MTIDKPLYASESAAEEGDGVTIFCWKNTKNGKE